MDSLPTLYLHAAELSNSFGCQFETSSEEVVLHTDMHEYGLDHLDVAVSERTRRWLSMNGDVRQIADLPTAVVTERWTGAYSAPNAHLTVRIPVADINNAVEEMYRRMDERDRQRKRCAICGAPATMSASLGPACQDHYDDLAN